MMINNGPRPNSTIGLISTMDGASDHTPESAQLVLSPADGSL
jgi:hypothetical protein